MFPYPRARRRLRPAYLRPVLRVVRCGYRAALLRVDDPAGQALAKMLEILEADRRD